MAKVIEGPRVLIFSGDGKGKTTAALGMVLRAAGHGLPTLVVSFIKADDTGELAAVRHLPGVAMRQVGLGFVPRRDDSPKMAEHRAAAVAGLDAAAADIASGRFRLVVLDEVCTAVARGLFDEEAVLAALHSAPADTVLVLTGRGATAGLIAFADTVTEMRCVKHGYETGFPAQLGVEF